MIIEPLLPAFETKCLSSLSKVFADDELADSVFERSTALANETFAYQVAYRSKERIRNIKVAVDSPIGSRVSIRLVGLVPSEFPINHDHDEHLLRTAPGLYPDPLYHLEDGRDVTALAHQWRSIWVTVELDGEVSAGIYPITVSFVMSDGRIIGQERFELEVISVSLPKQRLIHTEWFYTDCLADFYGVEIFGEDHWTLIQAYIQTAVRHGINMILTPIFTPPLDTAVGGERATTQLVDVEKNGGEYRFSFDKLERWVNLCKECGIEYFEFSHLFTQWGAKHAPKIMGVHNGRYERLFGWETDAAGEEYRSFLNQFLPELVKFIDRHRMEKNSYFHVSDEPHLEHLDAYRSASTILDAHLSQFPRIDALSDFAFYEKGLVPTPIPSTNRIEPFLEHDVPDLWTYYCCSQYIDVANRFFCFPSARNRIIGMQLYKYDIKGFLHWGYNFWNTQYSKKPINPYSVTDCDHAYPSGDAFLVYPGTEGPIESIRMEVFYDALQDLRALELLENCIGREQVLAILEEGLDSPITFKQYPRRAEWILNKRDEINRLIQQHARG